jgi:hypothetical protein
MAVDAWSPCQRLFIRHQRTVSQRGLATWLRLDGWGEIQDLTVRSGSQPMQGAKLTAAPLIKAPHLIAEDLPLDPAWV